MIAPAKTGRERRSRIVVTFRDQTNNGTRSRRICFDRMLIIVVIKFTDPRMDDTPARWREKMARSTEVPECAIFEARGGYTVQPVPTPFSTAALITNKINEGGRSQNLILFIRGNAISGAPSINGISQFPNPPIIIGITRKKIIRNA